MSFEIDTVATFADLVASPRREELTTVVISGVVKGKKTGLNSLARDDMFICELKPCLLFLLIS